jgi:hypothetical protein
MALEQFIRIKADRSYPAYPSVSRRAQVAGTGASLAMTEILVRRRVDASVDLVGGG